MTYCRNGIRLACVNRGAKILSALLSERGAQKRLAGELGIDQGYLSKIASGERIPGLDARRRLKPLGIDLEAWDEELLDLAPEPTAVARERGYRDGWVAHRYRATFGRWPRKAG